MMDLLSLELRGASVSDLSPLSGMTAVIIYLDQMQQVTIPKELAGRVLRF